MGAASKIIEGLKEALAYSRCRHEFTYWEHKPMRDGSKIWTRKCTKCKGTECRVSETEPPAM